MKPYEVELLVAEVGARRRRPRRDVPHPLRRRRHGRAGLHGARRPGRADHRGARSAVRADGIELGDALKLGAPRARRRRRRRSPPTSSRSRCSNGHGPRRAFRRIKDAELDALLARLSRPGASVPAASDAARLGPATQHEQRSRSDHDHGQRDRGAPTAGDRRRGARRRSSTSSTSSTHARVVDLIARARNTSTRAMSPTVSPYGAVDRAAQLDVEALVDEPGRAARAPGTIPATEVSRLIGTTIASRTSGTTSRARPAIGR